MRLCLVGVAFARVGWCVARCVWDCVWFCVLVLHLGLVGLLFGSAFGLLWVVWLCGVLFLGLVVLGVVDVALWECGCLWCGCLCGGVVAMWFGLSVASAVLFCGLFCSRRVWLRCVLLRAACT